MNIFLDTSALLAVLNANDRFHLPARDEWRKVLSSDTDLFTSNYIVLETSILLQHCHGIEAVRLFFGDIMPVVNVLWVDEVIHTQATSALLVANRRDLSLGDCTSFEILRKNGLDTVFTFDPHFQEQGFNVIPIFKERK
jgi:uncharacterized protein